MDISDYILYLFVTYSLFVLFFIIIAIFGSSLLFILKSRNGKDWELSKLHLLIISYAIGIAFYLIIAYTLLIFELLNFFTIYLSILIFDVIFITYILKKKRIQVNLSGFKSFLISNKKTILGALIVLLFIFYLQFLEFWPILTSNSSLLASDTYVWTTKVWFILDFGHIDNDLFGPAYPEGFPLICAGNLMIAPNKAVSYFFMKFGSMPFLTTYILVMYSISRDLFKRKIYLIFLCLILVLIYRYFMYRTIIFLPSLIANLLIFMCLVIIQTKLPNYLLGVLIPAIYLIHALSALIFLMCLGIFYFIILIRSIGERRRILKEVVMIGMISIISLIPLFIHSYIVFQTDLFSLISGYMNKLIPQISTNLPQINISKLKFPIQVQWIEEIIYFIDDILLYDFFNRYSIGSFLFFALAGLFIVFKEKNGKSRELVLIVKTGLLIVIFFYYFGNFVLKSYFPSPFYEFSILRPIETFAPYIIILTALTIKKLIKISEKAWIFLKANYLRSKPLKRFKFIRKHVNLKSIIIISLISSSLFYYVKREDIKPNYYYLTLPELILYININVPKGSNIALNTLWNDDNSFSENRMYVLLYNYDIFYYSGKNSLTFSTFLNFCLENSIDYIVLKKSGLNELKFLQDFENSTNYVKIYQVVESNLHYGIYKFNV